MAATSLQDALDYIVPIINADSILTSMGIGDAFSFSAPERTAFPYIIIGKQAGTFTRTLCGRAYDTHYMAIKCVDKGFDGGKRARQAMDRVAAIVELTNVSPGAGKLIMSIEPNNSYEYDEQENGNNNFYHSVIVFKFVLGQ